MDTIAIPLLAKVSFPDFLVSHFRIDNGCLEITVEGAWLDVGSGQALGPMKLVIARWLAIECRSYDFDQRTWHPSTKPVALKDLGEVSFADAFVSLRGFAQATGLWTEIAISRPEQLFLSQLK